MATFPVHRLIVSGVTHTPTVLLSSCPQQLRFLPSRWRWLLTGRVLQQMQYRPCGSLQYMPGQCVMLLSEYSTIREHWVLCVRQFFLPPVSWAAAAAAARPNNDDDALVVEHVRVTDSLDVHVCFMQGEEVVEACLSP